MALELQFLLLDDYFEAYQQTPTISFSFLFLPYREEENCSYIGSLPGKVQYVLLLLSDCRVIIGHFRLLPSNDPVLFCFTPSFLLHAAVSNCYISTTGRTQVGH